jgi:hypothetical protein
VEEPEILSDEPYVMTEVDAELAEEALGEESGDEEPGDEPEVSDSVQSRT